MRYLEFEHIVSVARMSRYRTATTTTKKAMTLYRLNLRLCQELFTIICCFEVALRNAINRECLNHLGNDWLQNAAALGGVFDNPRSSLTQTNINTAILKLAHNYTHSKLVAELGFGFWRFMYAPYQYIATGRVLMRVFPSKPTSTAIMAYNQNYIFNQLIKINELRNRIAHHEPICFTSGQPVKNTAYVRQHYAIIIQLFQWMNIDKGALLYGLDNVETICDKIDAL